MNCTLLNAALYYEKTYLTEALLFFTIFNTVYLYYIHTKTGAAATVSADAVSTAGAKSNSPPDYQDLL